MKAKRAPSCRPDACGATAGAVGACRGSLKEAGMRARDLPMRWPTSAAASPRWSASSSRRSAPIRWSHNAASAMSGGSMRSTVPWVKDGRCGRARH